MKKLKLKAPSNFVGQLQLLLTHLPTTFDLASIQDRLAAGQFDYQVGLQ